jgi:hypothetical protein
VVLGHGGQARPLKGLADRRLAVILPRHLCAEAPLVRFGAIRVRAIEINVWVTNITLTATFCY